MLAPPRDVAADRAARQNDRIIADRAERGVHVIAINVAVHIAAVDGDLIIAEAPRRKKTVVNSLPEGALSRLEPG